MYYLLIFYPVGPHIQQFTLEFKLLNDISLEPSCLIQLGKERYHLDLEYFSPSSSVDEIEFPTMLAEQIKSINLRGNKLTRLPESIFQYTNLESLDLGMTSKSFRRPVGNNLDTLQEKMVNFGNLLRLDLSSNNFSQFPEVLVGITSLRELNMAGNKLSKLPDELDLLVNLEKLALGANNLSSLPDTMGNLVSLQTLRINNNNLASLPEPLFKLALLRELVADFNQIEEISARICEQQGLESLGITNNQIRSLPNSMGDLKNLKILRINHNQLAHLPSWLDDLEKLEDLEITNNPLLPMGNQLESILKKLLGKGCRIDVLSSILWENARDINPGRLRPIHGQPMGKASYDRMKRNIIEGKYGTLGDLPLFLLMFNLLNNYTLVLGRSLIKNEGRYELVLRDKGLDSIDFPQVMREMITFLDLHQNNIQSLPDSLWDMASLQSLDIGANPISSLSGITKLAELREIQLNKTRITSFPDDLANLPNIERIYHHEGQFADLDDFPSHIKFTLSSWASLSQIASMEQRKKGSG